MSDDEDEELALLRLQALMSKRRGGAGASKDLPPFPLSLALVPVERTAPVSTETLVMTLPAVVTSVPAAVTDPTQGINNRRGTYRQPRFARGQASCSICSTVCSKKKYPLKFFAIFLATARNFYMKFPTFITRS